MEKSKSRPVSNTVIFSVFFSIAICFVALIHVEIELHAQRQLLQALNQQRQENVEPLNTVHDETTDSLSKILHGEGEKGE